IPQRSAMRLEDTAAVPCSLKSSSAACRMRNCVARVAMPHSHCGPLTNARRNVICLDLNYLEPHVNPLDLFDVRSALTDEERMVQDSVARLGDARVAPILTH